MNTTVNRECACHITDLRIGDTVIHNGVTVTVGKDDIKRSSEMGVTFRGDSYNLGTKQAIKLIADIY